MNNNYDVNSAIQSIMQMRNAGRNPQQIMQLLMQQNPQLQQSLTMLQNMAKGKNPQEFFTQLARQNGVSDQNLQHIMQMIQK
jgi:hypothetical protein